MKRSIFISRKLAADSILLNYLTKNDWTVYDRSLIRIEAIPFKIEGVFDWIFLSSSNGAKILLSSYAPNDETRIGAVGEATAKTLNKYGVFPDFVGDSGNMDQLADRLARTVGSGTVLFVGAEGGSEKIRNAIPSVQSNFVAVYRTVQADGVEIPNTTHVFLTSPSNAKYYLSSADISNKKVIAIGNTTAEFLSSRGMKNVLIPATPKEKDVVELLAGL